MNFFFTTHQKSVKREEKERFIYLYSMLDRAHEYFSFTRFA